MAKTQKTREIEHALWRTYPKMGIFGCFEVTIGWYGSEIVDFMTYNTNGEFRCYEIKVSKADFNSKNKVSFVGDFNYYVMPDELYSDLCKDPYFVIRLKNNGIGLLTLNQYGVLETKINAKRKKVDLSDKITYLQSMLRSSSREVNKFYKIKGYWEK